MTDALTTIARALLDTWLNGFSGESQDSMAVARALLDAISPGIVADAVKAEREQIAIMAAAHFIPGHSVASPSFAAHLAEKIRARQT